MGSNSVYRNFIDMAADQGLAVAMYMMGHRYRDGDGVRRDCYQALQWFRMAADYGYALGLNDMAWIHVSVPEFRNPEAALVLAKQCVRAQISVGGGLA